MDGYCPVWGISSGVRPVCFVFLGGTALSYGFYCAPDPAQHHWLLAGLLVPSAPTDSPKALRTRRNEFNADLHHRQQSSDVFHAGGRIPEFQPYPMESTHQFDFTLNLMGKLCRSS